MRRNFSVLTSVVLLFFFLVAGSAFAAGGGESSGSQETIKIGVLDDISGMSALVGIQKVHAYELAVQEIYEKGGLLGKKLEIIAPDCQSDTQRYQELARKLILEDKVDVIMGGNSSASREAIRPIIEENKSLLFYNNQYEGGVASHNVFCTGAVPEHQVLTLMKYMVATFGKRVYTIAADYNFGQLTAAWVKKITQQEGGTVVGEEFLPLTVSQFSASIDKIQKARPDILVVLLTGIAQSSFYGQWASAGMNVPIATTINIAQGYEHKRFAPPACADMYVTTQFVEELDTPAAADFVKKFHVLYPKEPYVGMEAAAAYTGLLLYAEGVKKAGTTEKEAVIKALESGISVEGPSGKVTIYAPTHHVIMDMWTVYSDKNHSISFKQKYDQIVPDWIEKEKGTDLTAKAPNVQFTP
jgi:branched-chain amino acid transport system substrate-binding protein